MIAFVLWLLLFFICWPLALVALLIYPIVWLFALPFRLAGFAVVGVFEVLTTILTLPFRVFSSRRSRY